MHKNILTVVGITILFLGLAIQPSIATIHPKEIDVEPDVKDIRSILERFRVNRIEQLLDLTCDCENNNTTYWFFGQIITCMMLYIISFSVLFLLNDKQLFYSIWNKGAEIYCWQYLPEDEG